MKTRLLLKKILLGAGLVFLLTGINSCSHDDDEGQQIINPAPAGTISIANDSQIISQNTIILDKVTSNTDVWLVAHYMNVSGEIIGQELITSERATNVEIALDAEELNDGDTVVFMLHADNGYHPGDGIFNVNTDIPITGAIETVVVNTPFFTISNATVTDNTITFDHVTVFNIGWIVVYDGKPNEKTSEIVGYTMVTGSEDGVNVILNQNYSDNDPLYARLHLEDQNDEEFSYMVDTNKDVPERFGFGDDNTIWNQLISRQQEETYTFEWYDANDDGTLDLYEAVESFNFSRYFTENWDTDDDGNLNQNEFYTSFFLNTDYSINNAISQAEWNSAYSGLLGNWSNDEFSEFDTNDNNELSWDEWISIFNESGWFEAYDTNGNSLVSLEEWHTGLFHDWDTNEDDRINKVEFERYIYYVFSWIRW